MQINKFIYMIALNTYTIFFNTIKIIDKMLADTFIIL
jgi:hypothetical protein